MKTIFRFSFKHPERARNFKISHNAKFLHARERAYFNEVFNRVCMWWEGDDDRHVLERRFILLSDGDEIPPMSSYIGTAFPNSGVDVVHIYEAPLE